MKNGLKVSVGILSGILAFWTLLTFWAKAEGFGKNSNGSPNTREGIGEKRLSSLVIQNHLL
jgi:hypothetical protein